MPTSTITRRAALTGSAAGAAAIVAGTIHVTADDHDRAQWLALWDRWVEQSVRDILAFRILDEAQGEAWSSLDDIEERDAARAAVEARFNVPALQRASDHELARKKEIEDEIASRPAHSMVGIAIKLALWVHMDGQLDSLGDTLDDAPVETETAIAAYRDAVRLAGLPEDLWEAVRQATGSHDPMPATMGEVVS